MNGHDDGVRLNGGLALFPAFVLCCLAVLPCTGQERASPWDEGGDFWRLHWYERGLEHGNPFYNSRFRVNSPEAALLPAFKDRSEVRGNGLMLILAEEDLGQISAADLYLEIWGGHPGTANKRVMVNGRSQYSLPEVGTAAGHCTHQYPTIPLRITDLVNGYNAVQFSCDQGASFWGHFIVDNACLRVALRRGHPDLIKADLADFSAEVEAACADDRAEGFQLTLAARPADMARIASVDFLARYAGYDENGDGRATDWHGFTKGREPAAIVASVREPAFSVLWDTSMLVDQEEIAVRAIVHFKGQPGIVYVTRPRRAPRFRRAGGSHVAMVRPGDMPAPFWSRAGKKNRCTITLDADPERIQRAELHVVAWDGGAGTVRDYFTLNRHPLPIAGEGRHDVIYSRVPIDPGILRRGPNEIELLSDTDHHGIEILLPGPALVIRAGR